MSSEHRLKNFIFDWSGVISNDFPLVHKTYLKIFEHYKKPPMSMEEFRAKFRLPYMEFCHEHLGRADEKELGEIFKKYYTEEKCAPDPIDGVEDILRRLKKIKKNLAVMSSHSFVSLETKRFFPGKKYFSAIYEDIPNKEHALPRLIREMRLKLQETVYIGDMVHDIRAGKKAGVRTAAVLTGYQTRDALSAEKPDYILNTLDDIFREMPL
jgi:HAD superfamily hydrolase (TIGR01549 family)